MNASSTWNPLNYKAQLKTKVTNATLPLKSGPIKDGCCKKSRVDRENHYYCRWKQNNLECDYSKIYYCILYSVSTIFPLKIKALRVTTLTEVVPDGNSIVIVVVVYNTTTAEK